MSAETNAPRQLKIWEAYLIPILLIPAHLGLISGVQALFLNHFGADRANLAAIIGVMVLNIIMIPVYGWYLKNRDRRAPASLLNAPRSRRSLTRAVAWAFVGIIIAMLVSSGLVALLQQIPGAQDILERFQGLQEVLAGMDVPLWASLLSICLFAPITEELLLRGIVLGGLKDRMKPGLANLITAILFGVMHLNLIQGIYAAVLGLILGHVYLRTENLRYPILVHILINFCGSGIAQIFDLQNNLASAGVYALIMLVLAIISVGVLIRLRVTENRERYGRGA